MEQSKRVLVLAPHPDDGEFGCGGTIHKLKEQGAAVYYAAFSPCTKSVPKDFEKEVLFDELRAATGVLGIDEEHVMTFNFEVRNFKRERQLILEELVEMKKSLNPDLIFVPNSNDIHQDHETICEEGKRAFKQCKILGYELPWNNVKATTNFHVKLSQDNVQAKIKAIDCYKSQQFRNYADDDFIRSLAVVRGKQTGNQLAEAFELIHWVS